VKRATFVFVAVCAASLIGCGNSSVPTPEVEQLGDKLEQHDKPFQTVGDTSPDSFAEHLVSLPPEKQAEELKEKASVPALRTYYKKVFEKFANSSNANVAAAAKEGLAPAKPTGTK
jgi:hypothetical protein